MDCDQVKAKFCQDVLQQVLGAEMEPKYVSAFVNRLGSLSEKFGPKGLKCVDQERFMTVALEEKKLMLERLAKVRVQRYPE